MMSMRNMDHHILLMMITLYINMAEYVWTFNLFGVRIGWLKHGEGWYWQGTPKKYLQIGRLDFYII